MRKKTSTRKQRDAAIKKNHGVDGLRHFRRLSKEVHQLGDVFGALRGQALEIEVAKAAGTLGVVRAWLARRRHAKLVKQVTERAQVVIGTQLTMLHRAAKP